MRFCVNVSILFTEVPLLERFARARDAGFDAVELWWPRGEDVAAVQRRDRGRGRRRGRCSTSTRATCPPATAG